MLSTYMIVYGFLSAGWMPVSRTVTISTNCRSTWWNPTLRDHATLTLATKSCLFFRITWFSVQNEFLWKVTRLAFGMH